jgi:hypothetical protein
LSCIVRAVFRVNGMTPEGAQEAIEMLRAEEARAGATVH